MLEHAVSRPTGELGPAMPDNVTNDTNENLIVVAQRDREIKFLAECALAVVADRIVSLRRPTADILERDLCNAVLHEIRAMCRPSCRE